MGGFVAVRDGQTWAVSNAAWRATVEPASELLAVGTEARARVEHALRDGMHSLDLRACGPATVRAVEAAVVEVRDRYQDGRLKWMAEDVGPLLLALDALVEMFTDPAVGRPIWEPSR